MKATVYHNVRCSKCRDVISILQENNVEIDVVNYLAYPPTKSEIRILIGKLGIEASGLVRRKERMFKELEIGNMLDDEATLIDAMAAHPILIERPIVVVGDRAVIGRPPENVLSLIPSVI